MSDAEKTLAEAPLEWGNGGDTPFQRTPALFLRKVRREEEMLFDDSIRTVAVLTIRREDLPTLREAVRKTFGENL